MQHFRHWWSVGRCGIDRTEDHRVHESFSGKDPTKVAYATRLVAKSLVMTRFCKRCVQISYAIGVPELFAIAVSSYGTWQYSEVELLEIVMHNFDLRPGVIIRELILTRPMYEKTAANGHFGNEDIPCEQVKTLESVSNKRERKKQRCVDEGNAERQLVNVDLCK